MRKQSGSEKTKQERENSSELRAELDATRALLSRSEELLSLSLEVSQVGFYEWDIESDHVTYSDQMMRTWGLEEGGRLEAAIERIHPDDRAHAAALIQRSLSENVPFNTRYRVVKPDGRIVLVKANGRVHRNALGQPVRFVGTAVDVTEEYFPERLAAEARHAVFIERTNFYSLFEQTPEMVCSLSGPDHTFEFVNAAHIRVLGFDATGMNVRSAQPESVEVHGILDKVYATGETAQLTELAVTVGKRTRYFNLTYAPRRDVSGRIDGVLILGAEVTDIVVTRKALESSEQDSRRAVAELRSEREAREHFVATLTHDLCVPLTAASLSTELLLRKPDAVLDVQKRAARILKNIARVNEMVRNLLDANRIKAGETLPLEFERCDLRMVVEEALVQLSGIYGDRFRLDVDGDTTGVFSDSGIRRLIENLCNNAIKYGDASAPVKVTLRRLGECFEIAVHNDGEPIPHDVLPSLFAPYKRSSTAETGKATGWGLGLTLVKGIALSHGGSVDASSTRSAGTMFTVRIPAESKVAG